MLQKLKVLDAVFVIFYSNSRLEVAKLINLQTLHLSSNISVDDELLEAIGKNCMLLETVNSSC